MQADDHTQLAVVGETRLPLIRHGRPLTLEALVVKDLDVDILAGMPFMTSNDMVVPKVFKPTMLSELVTSFAPRTLTPLSGRVSSLKSTSPQSCLQMLHLPSNPVWIWSVQVTSNLLTSGLNPNLFNALAVS